MTKLGFIGVGNMGGAILKGIEGKLGTTAVFAFDANKDKLADLTLLGATAAGSARDKGQRKAGDRVHLDLRGNFC